MAKKKKITSRVKHKPFGTAVPGGLKCPQFSIDVIPNRSGCFYETLCTVHVVAMVEPIFKQSPSTPANIYIGRPIMYL